MPSVSGEASLPLANRERLRRGRLLALLIGVNLPLDVLLIPSAFVPALDWASLSALLMHILSSLGSALLNRKGHVEEAATGYLMSIIAACAVYLFCSPPISFLYGCYAYAFYTLVVVNSGFLLGRRAPCFYAAISIAIISLHVGLNSHRFHALPGFQNQPVYVFALIPAIVLIMLATLACLGAGSMEDALLRADKADEMETLNQQLQAMQEELISGNRELAEANAKLEALATTDGMTGLPNHRAFQERLRAEIALYQRAGHPLCALLLDVDHFKQYNDSFGHPAGDSALRIVARLLRENVRGSDLAARYGGEEFAVILPGTSMEEALPVVERLRCMIESYPFAGRKITVSIGLAGTENCEADAEAMIAGADLALYQAKHRGRNRIAIFQRDLLQPYADLMQQMAAVQEEVLLSARDPIRETLTGAYEPTVENWASLLDMRHQKTAGHAERVTEITVRLARSLGMTEEEVLYARWGAMLHDIGKMGIPDSILLKPGPLTEAEWEMIRRHPEIAHQMLAPIAFLRPVRDIPYCHHEKWDGSGYPRGLQGEEIPLAARLFALADVWDALRSDRPYRQGWPAQRVLDYIISESGKHFDPRAVQAFLRLIENAEVSPASFPAPTAA